MKHLLLAFALLTTGLLSAQELVYQDEHGVIRYTANDEEMAVFGVNYCLPSASDYRAAHKVIPTLEGKKRLIDSDLKHLSRMGMRAIRLSFWGDWENSDRAGNLLDNDHLELLDYLVCKASAQGMLMLFSPVVAHAAWWPDGDRNLPGLTAHFGKESLTFDKRAIRAQQRYMTQFLNYRNRYTGNRYKEEPHIIAIEILNEPARVMERNEEIRAYIDTMTATIRKTGCQKIIAYNLSENFSTAEAIRTSEAQAATYGWYPTQLTHGYTLQGNYLPYVNDYTPMKTVDIGPRSKFVYEFDAADMTASYMYPAQVREFREGGVQWAAMFSYDMLATAPWNLGWQTHLLNLVFTPKKAISALIAAKAMEALPRGKDWGNYPHNSAFGPVTVDWKGDRSIYYDGKTLLYSNSLPADFEVEPHTLTQLAGTGSSSLFTYGGSGAYFLDKLADGVWMLEIYPGANQLQDPFQHAPNLDRQIFEAETTGGWVTLSLPDLGEEFYILSCAEEGDRTNRLFASQQRGFHAETARYILAREPKLAQQYAEGRTEDGSLKAALPLTEWAEFGYKAAPSPRTEQTTLFQPKRDYNRLIFTRGGFFSPSYVVRLTEAGTLHLTSKDMRHREEHWFPADISVQHPIKAQLDSLDIQATDRPTLTIRARALTPSTTTLRVLVSEEDFGSWGATLTLDETWKEYRLDALDFRPDRTPQLPQDWPGFAPYYRPDFGGTGHRIDWSEVENLYFSLRAEDFEDQGTTPKGVEIEWVKAELIKR